MKTALVYILTSISLAGILALARSSGHEAKNGVEVFRYQPGLLRVIFWGCPVPLILMAFDYVVTPSAMRDSSLVTLLLVTAVLGSSLICYAYKYLDSFRVEVGKSGIKISSIQSSKSIEFKNIKRVNCLEGDKGVFYLDVFDAQEKRVAHLPSTLQDFDDLHRLIREGAKECGATYRYRDKWGKWYSAYHRY